MSHSFQLEYSAMPDHDASDTKSTSSEESTQIIVSSPNPGDEPPPLSEATGKHRLHEFTKNVAEGL